MAKVIITTAGHTVEIHSSDELEIVATRALQIWMATRDPKLDRAYAAGFAQAEAAPGGHVGEDDSARRGLTPTRDY